MDRRDFMKHAVIALSALYLPDFLPDAEADSIISDAHAEHLLAALKLCGVTSLGQSYLKKNPNDGGLDSFISSLAIADKKDSRATVVTLAAALQERSISDFRLGRIVSINGWIVSQTEARLLANLALFETPSDCFYHIDDLAFSMLSKKSSARMQRTGDFNGYWPEGKQVLISGEGVGDGIKMRLPDLTSGEYELSLFLCRAPDYGIVSVESSDSLLAEEIDLWSGRRETVVSTGPTFLGTIALDDSTRTLSIRFTGHHPDSLAPFFQAGVAGVLLTPAIVT